MLENLFSTNFFVFTQQSLATFTNCPLKFKKRYNDHLKWDNYPEETIKKRIERGNDFHLLAQRYFLGIDIGLLEEKEEHLELKSWINNLKSKFSITSDNQYLPEYKLRMNSSFIKLEANFDLLIVKNNEIQIWDWKTHSGSLRRNKLLKNQLIDSLQTKVYLFMLKENARLVFGKEIPSQNISMYYWQPDPAEIIGSIQYNDAMHENFREVIKSKIMNILEYDYSMFNKELYRKHCKFCEFNWFCNKGEVDFNLVEEDEEFFDP